MTSRFFVHALFATLVVGGFAFAADALVVSDEEAVEQLGEDLTDGEMDDLLRWIDLGREAVSLQTDGRSVVYEEGEDLEVSDALAEALEPFGASDLEVIQRSSRIDGDRATVSVRARARGELHDATFHLVRGGSSWWIARVVAR